MKTKTILNSCESEVGELVRNKEIRSTCDITTDYNLSAYSNAVCKHKRIKTYDKFNNDDKCLKDRDNYLKLEGNCFKCKLRSAFKFLTSNTCPKHNRSSVVDTEKCDVHNYFDCVRKNRGSLVSKNSYVSLNHDNISTLRTENVKQPSILLPNIDGINKNIKQEVLHKADVYSNCSHSTTLSSSDLPYYEYASAISQPVVIHSQFPPSGKSDNRPHPSSVIPLIDDSLSEESTSTVHSAIPESKPVLSTQDYLTHLYHEHLIKQFEDKCGISLSSDNVNLFSSKQTKLAGYDFEKQPVSLKSGKKNGRNSNNFSEKNSTFSQSSLALIKSSNIITTTSSSDITDTPISALDYRNEAEGHCLQPTDVELSSEALNLIGFSSSIISNYSLVSDDLAAGISTCEKLSDEESYNRCLKEKINDLEHLSSSSTAIIGIPVKEKNSQDSEIVNYSFYQDSVAFSTEVSKVSTLTEFSDESEEIGLRSDQSTSDCTSISDCDVQPIDDSYFDLHYDPYFQSSLEVDSFPDDQPIDYPPLPHLTRSWWQLFDSKPGSELYRSQSQPHGISSKSLEQPLDGNLPLHLFLSSSQPSACGFGSSAGRSNSFENLISKTNKKEFGSLRSSYGSQLYTIKEEIEVYECGETPSCNVNTVKHDLISSLKKYVVPCNAVPQEGSSMRLNDKEGDDFTYSTSVMKEFNNSEIIVNRKMSCNLSSDAKEEGRIPRPLLSSSNENLMNPDCLGGVVKLPDSSASLSYSNMNKRPSKEVQLNLKTGLNQFLYKSNSSPDLVIGEGIQGCDSNPITNFNGNDTNFNGTRFIKDNCNSLFPNCDNRSEITNGNLHYNSTDADNLNCILSDAGFDSAAHDENDIFSCDKSDSNLSSSDEQLTAKPSSIYGATISLHQLPISPSNEVNGLSPNLQSSSQSFGAYSSDTSLDFDMFSKSSKAFKWNRSSSVSDLSSLTKEFNKCPENSWASRVSISASDLICYKDNSDISGFQSGTTTYMQWSSEVKEDFEEQPNSLFPGQSNTSSFVFTPHSSSSCKKSPLFSLYSPHGFSSDESEEEFSTSEESEESDEESEEGGGIVGSTGLMRSYQIGPPSVGANHGFTVLSDTCLATITEDIEEESSGSEYEESHSAPHPQTKAYPSDCSIENDGKQHHQLHDTNIEIASTCGNLVTEKLTVSCSTNSDKFLLDNLVVERCSTKESSPENFQLVKPSVDDIFDFSSLETCEIVSNCDDLIIDHEVHQNASDSDVVFRTSATSRPFRNTKSTTSNRLTCKLTLNSNKTSIYPTEKHPLDERKDFNIESVKDGMLWIDDETSVTISTNDNINITNSSKNYINNHDNNEITDKYTESTVENDSSGSYIDFNDMIANSDSANVICGLPKANSAEKLDKETVKITSKSVISPRNAVSTALTRRNEPILSIANSKATISENLNAVENSNLNEMGKNYCIFIDCNEGNTHEKELEDEVNSRDKYEQIHFNSPLSPICCQEEVTDSLCTTGLSNLSPSLSVSDLPYVPPYREERASLKTRKYEKDNNHIHNLNEEIIAENNEFKLLQESTAIFCNTKGSFNNIKVAKFKEELNKEVHCDDLKAIRLHSKLSQELEEEAPESDIRDLTANRPALKEDTITKNEGKRRGRVSEGEVIEKNGGSDEGFERFNEGISPLNPFSSVDNHISQINRASFTLPFKECSRGSNVRENIELNNSVVYRSVLKDGIVRPYSLVDLCQFSNVDFVDGQENMGIFKNLRPSCLFTRGDSNDNTSFLPSFFTQKSYDVVKASSLASDLKSNSKGMSSATYRPRRHQSMYVTSANEFTWESAPRASYVQASKPYVKNLPRPQPLTLNMAEEFLSQEGLSHFRHASKINSESTENYLAQNKVGASRGLINGDKGGGAYSPGRRGTNQDEMGGAKLYLYCNDEENKLRDFNSNDELNWHSFDVKEGRTVPFVHNQLEECCTTVSSIDCSAAHNNINDHKSDHELYSEFQNDDSSENNQLNSRLCEGQVSNQPRSDIYTRQSNRDTMAAFPPNTDNNKAMKRVHTKTYGPHGEVEVYVARNGDNIAISNSPVAENCDTSSYSCSNVSNPNSRQNRGVKFSPNVKEVNWRESYLDPDDGDYLYTQMEDKEIRKVRVVSCESPKPQKCQQIFKPLHNNTIPSSDCALSMDEDNDRYQKVNNNNNNDKSEFSVRRPIDNNNRQNRNLLNNEVNVSYDNKSVKSKEEKKQCQQKQPLHERNDAPHSHPIPIWQRLKLVKSNAPKGPRPKIPPKPSSLSPKTSDNESPLLSSPASSPESELSSSSSPEMKMRKIPTSSSARFTLWGNKNEKKKGHSELIPRKSDTTNVSPNTTCHPTHLTVSPSELRGSKQVNKVNKVHTIVIPNSEKLYNERSVDWIDDNIDSNRIANGVVLNNTKNNSSRERSCPQDVNGKYAGKNSHEFVETLQSHSDVPNNYVGDNNVPLNNGITNSDYASYSSSASTSPEGILLSAADRKPPLPPHMQGRNNQKFRVQCVRRTYLSPTRTDVSVPTRKALLNKDQSQPTTSELANSSSPLRAEASFSHSRSTSERLKERFEKFSKATRAEREKLARSTPDLSRLEESVRRSLSRNIDSNCSVSTRIVDSFTSSGSASGDVPDSHSKTCPSNDHSLSGVAQELSSATPNGSSFTRPSYNALRGSKINAEFDRISQRSRARSSCRSSQSIGVLETDLDTGTSVQVLQPQETNLDDLYQDLQKFLDTLPQLPLNLNSKDKNKAQSLLHLDNSPSEDSPEAEPDMGSRGDDSRARSMEFLLDDENRAAVQAPENELMKDGERKMSEAELRVRRSLQRLDVPEWMKNSTPQQGFLLRRKDYSSGTSSGGWSGVASKTTSMSSLGSNRGCTPPKVGVPLRASTRSYGGLTSPNSNASISPSPSDKVDKTNTFQYPLSRWSTSRLNSGTVTPTGSIASQRSLTSYGRQPYLGWRSNTSLNNSGLGGSQSSLTGSSYLSPAERLAQSLLQAKEREAALKKSTANRKSSSFSNLVSKGGDKVDTKDSSQSGKRSSLDRSRPYPDVHSSIREVTSAIVHYCKETSSPKLSPKGSPNLSQKGGKRMVWVESSFVGSQPITSPQTPTKPSLASSMNGHQEDRVESRHSSHHGEYLMAH